MASSHTFLLIHGAWHGGWCWQRVAERLEARGHRVLTPTLPGLAEDDGFDPAEVSLQTHVDAVVHLADAQRLTDFILVGHSYAGLVITGAADVLRERVRHTIYLDAAVPVEMTPGATYRWSAANTPQEIELRMKRIREEGQGVALPAPPPEAFAVFDPEDAEWLRQRLRPMPLQTYLATVTLRNGGSNGLRRTYVAARKPPYQSLVPAYERVRTDPSWSCTTIEAGHDMMVTAPEALTALLIRLATVDPKNSCSTTDSTD